MQQKEQTPKNKKRKWIIALIVMVLLVLTVIIFRDSIRYYINEFLFKDIYASW